MAEYAVYHESQESGFCGKHCLNNLLQSPMFSEVDLSNIALELDEQERSLMAESMGGVDSPEYLRWLQENENPNVSLDGNFSIQVLRKALDVMGLQCIRVGSELLKHLGNASKEQSFICNLQAHWFAIRKLGSVWYNLNSLKKGPEIISDFYLSAYLETLQNEGYDIFAVRGIFSEPMRTPDGDGKWYTIAQINKITADASKSSKKRTQADSGDPQMRAAIAASLQDIGEGPSGDSGGGAGSSFGNASSEDDELKRALELSMQDMRHPNAMKFPSSSSNSQNNPHQTSSSSSSSSHTSHPQNSSSSTSYQFPQGGGHSLKKKAKTDEEKALDEAIKMSLEEDNMNSLMQQKLLERLPEEPEAGTLDTVSIQIQLPNGQKLKRRFNNSDRFEHIFIYVNSQEEISGSYNLVTTFPRQVFSDPTKTISSARLGRQILLRTEPTKKKPQQ